MTMISGLQDKTGKVMPSESIQKDFVKQYIEARKKEHRFYTNEEVGRLPRVPASHPLFKEWLVRKRSADMIVNYLHKKKRPLKILEVGCGNGWLSAAMCEVDQSCVTGIDINDVELNQARQVFHHLNNLQFICTGINGGMLQPHSFDVIVFAASIQYFAAVKPVINAALSLLSAGGDIHIIDSHFYKAAKIEAASKRTGDYYTALGLPEMAKYYHHHLIRDFSSFNFSILFAPSFLQQKIFRYGHPFYWIKINHTG